MFFRVFVYLFTFIIFIIKLHINSGRSPLHVEVLAGGTDTGISYLRKFHMPVSMVNM